MSGTTEWVSTHRKCRICGKEDYCKFGTFPNGDTLEYCHRKSGSKGETTVGVDGNIYRWTRETDWGFHVWEPEEQYERNLNSYLESLGIKRNREYKQVPVTHAEPQKTREPEIPIASPAILDKVYRYFLSLLRLEEFHRQALFSEWVKVDGLGEEILKAYPIVSLPPKDKERSREQYRVTNLQRSEIMLKMEHAFKTLKGVPGFFLNGEHWDIISGGGILFPVYNSRKQIVALRLGDDHPMVNIPVNGVVHDCYFNYGNWGYWQDGKFYKLKGIRLTKRGYPQGAGISGKYKNFSSSKTIEIDGAIKAKYPMSCSAGSQLSLYGKDSDDWSIVYLTEGEKKSMVANLLLGHPVVNIPGVASFGKLFQNELGMEKTMVDYLLERGTRLFVIAYDADKKVNQDVLRSEFKAVKAFVEKGLYIAIGEWNPSWGKGLDDILLSGVRPSMTMVTV